MRGWGRRPTLRTGGFSAEDAENRQCFFFSFFSVSLSDATTRRSGTVTEEGPLPVVDQTSCRLDPLVCKVSKLALAGLAGLSAGTKRPFSPRAHRDNGTHCFFPGLTQAGEAGAANWCLGSKRFFKLWGNNVGIMRRRNELAQGEQ